MKSWEKINKKGNRFLGEYYCYKLQMRDDESIILHTGRLFQQYTVYEWIKIENPRLNFTSFNQDFIRTDVLWGFLDVLHYDEREASQVGRIE